MQVYRTKIIKLIGGYTKSNGWRALVDDFDQKQMCTPHDIFKIQQRRKYLSHALYLAMENMPQKTWIECCRMAIKDIDKFELIMSDSYHVDNNNRIINPFTLST